MIATIAIIEALARWRQLPPSSGVLSTVKSAEERAGWWWIKSLHATLGALIEP